MDVKEFDLRTVLTVTTGHIIDTDYKAFVDFMGYMRGGVTLSLFEATEWREKAAEELFRQHPWLEDIKFPSEAVEVLVNATDEERRAYVTDWVSFCGVLYGETVDVMPMDDGMLLAV